MIFFVFLRHHDHHLEVLHCRICVHFKMPWLDEETEYRIQFDLQISIWVAFSKSFAWSVLKSRELANWGWFPAEFDFQEILAQGNLQNSWHSDAFVDIAKGDFIIKGFSLLDAIASTSSYPQWKENSRALNFRLHGWQNCRMNNERLGSFWYGLQFAMFDFL